MVRYLILFLSIVLLGACATTSEPETKNITQTISSINETSAGSRPDASGFIDLADGARYQNVTGLRCPGSVFGVDLDSTVAYTRDLSDVSCLYKSPPNMVTLYLSRFPDLKFEDYFASSFNAVQQGLNKITLKGA
jgi:hypothetical protein